MKPTDPIVLKYFNLGRLGGRGGVQRFFLLANGIPFIDDIVEFSYWGAEGKAKSYEDNPCGTLPITYVGAEDNKSPLIQHIASSRYLARLHGVTKDMSAYDEYVQDLVADEYMGFRDAWVQANFNGSDDEKKKFKEETVPTILTKFDKLYAKFKTTGDDGVYLSTSAAGNPLWGDAAMFGLMRDATITGFIDMDAVQKSYTNLWSMYESFAKIDAVKEWLDKH